MAISEVDDVDQRWVAHVLEEVITVIIADEIIAAVSSVGVVV